MAPTHIAPDSSSMTATFRFHAELNDLLPAVRRGIATVHVLPRPTNVEDATESQGVARREGMPGLD